MDEGDSIADGQEGGSGASSNGMIAEQNEHGLDVCGRGPVDFGGDFTGIAAAGNEMPGRCKTRAKEMECCVETGLAAGALDDIDGFGDVAEEGGPAKQDTRIRGLRGRDLEGDRKATG